MHESTAPLLRLATRAADIDRDIDNWICILKDNIPGVDVEYLEEARFHLEGAVRNITAQVEIMNPPINEEEAA